VGIENIVNTAHNMGIKSKLDPTPSLTLGSSDVNLLEMVNAYCTPVNDGKHIDPVLVAKIEDRDGNVIYQAPTEAKQVIPYRSAFLVQQLLKGGMSGTSSRLMGFVGYEKAADTDFGGKTGTSNNHSDAWFIGTTPKLVVGAWVGGEYRSIHFRTGMLGQGNRTALPICGYFLGSVLNDKDFKQYRCKFSDPHHDASLYATEYDCGGYFRAPADSDSISIDSLDIEELDPYTAVDEWGNPVPPPNEKNDGEAQPEPTETDNTEAVKDED
jgi:penicillin-binding protein 1A